MIRPTAVIRVTSAEIITDSPAANAVRSSPEFDPCGVTDVTADATVAVIHAAAVVTAVPLVVRTTRRAVRAEQVTAAVVPKSAVDWKPVVAAKVRAVVNRVVV